MDSTFCVDEPKCIPEARADHKSVTDGTQGDFTSMPITIVHQRGSSVEFQVEQKWKDGDIGWIAVTTHQRTRRQIPRVSRPGLLVWARALPPTRLHVPMVSLKLMFMLMIVISRT